MLSVPTQPDNVPNTNTFAVIETTGKIEFTDPCRVDFLESFSISRPFQPMILSLHVCLVLCKIVV